MYELCLKSYNKYSGPKLQQIYCGLPWEPASYSCVNSSVVKLPKTGTAPPTSIYQGGSSRPHNHPVWESPCSGRLSGCKLQSITCDLWFVPNLLVSTRYHPHETSSGKWFCNPLLLGWRVYNCSWHGWKESISVFNWMVMSSNLHTRASCPWRGLQKNQRTDSDI